MSRQAPGPHCGAPPQIAGPHTSLWGSYQDRWTWIDVIAEWIAVHTAASRPGVITCSADDAAPGSSPRRETYASSRQRVA